METRILLQSNKFKMTRTGLKTDWKLWKATNSTVLGSCYEDFLVTNSLQIYGYNSPMADYSNSQYEVV